MRDKLNSGSVSRIHYHRLVLCEVTADVMSDGFKILGIKSVDKM